MRSPSGLSRRRFLRRGLRTAAAVAAGPLLLPSRTLGRGGGVSPANRITIGFIGTGRQAFHANLPGFLREPDAQVVALCDVDRWRVEQARGRVADHYAKREPGGTFRGVAIHRDFRELLARPEVDAVMISTPDHWHVPMALLAVQAGKDVCCEKPLTRSIPEGRRLSDFVTRRGRVFRTDSEFRSIRAFQRAAELARNGRLGRLEALRTVVPETDEAAPMPEPGVAPPELDYDLWLGPAPAAPYHVNRVHPRENLSGRPGWMRCRDYNDGLIANWGAHVNDIALWAADLERTGPVEIEGRGELPPPSGLWNVLLRFEAEHRFANGVRLTCRSGPTPGVEIRGSEGWIRVDYPNAVTAEPASLLEWTPGPTDLRFPLKEDKRDFLDAVKTRGRPLEDAEVGHRVNSIALLGLLAIERGRSVRWDPVGERFPEDPEAQRALSRPPWREPWASLVNAA